MVYEYVPSPSPSCVPLLILLVCLNVSSTPIIYLYITHVYPLYAHIIYPLYTHAHITHKKSGNITTLRPLLEEWSGHAILRWCSDNEGGYTPLHTASVSGSLAVVGLLCATAGKCVCVCLVFFFLWWLTVVGYVRSVRVRVVLGGCFFGATTKHYNLTI